LFQPVRRHGQLLVDGAMSMEIRPAWAGCLRNPRDFGAPASLRPGAQPANHSSAAPLLQILQSNSEHNGAANRSGHRPPTLAESLGTPLDEGRELIEAGEAAALAALPKIQEWLQVQPVAANAQFQPAQV